MAGVGEACAPCDLLYLKPARGDEELLCLADAEGRQIFVGRAVEIAVEQPCQVLGRNKDQTA